MDVEEAGLLFPSILILGIPHVDRNGSDSVIPFEVLSSDSHGRLQPFKVHVHIGWLLSSSFMERL